jgi:hypothetical protein
VDIQITLRRLTLDLRAINRFIQGTDFSDTWNRSKINERDILIDFIKNVDIEGVRQQLLVMRQNELTKCDLVYLARRYGIKNYSRKTKFQLIKELRKRGISDKSIAAKC